MSLNVAPIEPIFTEARTMAPRADHAVITEQGHDPFTSETLDDVLPEAMIEVITARQKREDDETQAPVLFDSTVITDETTSYRASLIQSSPSTL